MVKTKFCTKNGKYMYIKHQKKFMTLKSYKKQFGGIGCNVLPYTYSNFKNLVDSSRQVNNNGTITYGYLMFCTHNSIHPTIFCLINETVYQIIDQNNNLIFLLDELKRLGFAPPYTTNIWHSTTLPDNI